ncbi:hypothetical protein [Paenibacillus silviterrae]|uniref:hypothetical protein n=1 Tax=Paenibacillus silviterrae TaxID=3242194 RepID=UPI0025431264|nr:hypothetical protein [Paenibacillus chinjuensis]
MKQHLIIELVSAHLKSGVSREAFLSGIRQSQRALERYPGFRSRVLAHDTDHQLWFDLVQWADLLSAEAAAADFMKDPAAKALIDSLEETTVTMRHYVRQEALSVPTSRNAAGTSAGCVELLMYRLKPGANGERYGRAVRDMSEKMQVMPAFIRREVYIEQETGEWLEAIFYQNREAADAMFLEIKDAPCMQQCMELLDEASLRMHWASPVEWE